MFSMLSSIGQPDSRFLFGSASFFSLPKKDDASSSTTSHSFQHFSAAVSPGWDKLIFEKEIALASSGSLPGLSPNIYNSTEENKYTKLHFRDILTRLYAVVAESARTSGDCHLEFESDESPTAKNKLPTKIACATMYCGGEEKESK